jgi:hypothetical protein
MKTLYLIGIAVLALCVIGGIFFFFSQSGSYTATNSAASTAAQATSSAGVVSATGAPLSATSTAQSITTVDASGNTTPAGYLAYHNDAYHFSLVYPDNLSVAEHDQSGGDVTFTFEDDKNVQGFQIFIQPFSGTQITDAQFEADDPSGVRDDPESFTLDGASGVAFYSQDHLLGATREMWFIHGGYLYEVTTFKELSSWLDSIMQSWEFD